MRPSVLVALLVMAASPAAAQQALDTGMEHKPRVTAYARDFIKGFADDPMLHAVVRESTKSHRKLDWGEARALDRRWKNELADKTPDGLVDTVSHNALSKWLKQQQDGAPGGAVTEILIIDGLGWNIGQTLVTSDFFQGDELQWQDILPNAPNAVAVSELEDNGHGQKSLALVSLPITDGDTNIGVITLGVDVSKIP
ncbi:hypothetical protein IZ6_20870 [Terrihabitans soli]|uniref:Uncharacterized protein n=1 Tax=Terrihabitans soli TaxID=708113 RepID=A0A6S6QVR4_9HYPH|nr:hypothetical protein [Terrihabitans soli]BCJ91352.1 hypothetical protein IZ6_20870 [Terrihabitans soli]